MYKSIYSGVTKLGSMLLLLHFKKNALSCQLFQIKIPLTEK